MTTDFKNYRPIGFNRKEDTTYIAIINGMEKLITETQKQYLFNTIKLDNKQRRILSILLIEFAEDLHCDIGLWKSLEFYNQQLFNTPLPLFVKSETEITELFDVNRIRYFIHSILSEIANSLILSPNQKDLTLLSINVSEFLCKKFQNIPQVSGIKEFLSLPNNYGWDFKRKLVWTGTNSYLFRFSFYKYMTENNNGKMEIPVTDDFVCQENTIWSGLGVTDILAKALNLPEKISKDVRSWYERFASFYRIISSTDHALIVENIINETTYHIYIDKDQSKIFKAENIFFGSIVPYGEYWYWSGVQHDLGKIDKNETDKIKIDFKRTSSAIIYRYDKDLLNNAREMNKKQHEEFIAFFGSDLMIFKDGLSMAASLHKKNIKKFESLPKKEQEDHMKKHGLKNQVPKMNLPDELVYSENGVCAYFNPDEGMEIMFGFDNLISGFKKKGIGLSFEEEEAIINFMESNAISPNFVKKITDKYGVESLFSSFCINPEMADIEYLFHRYKGHFYRNRYPAITLVGD